MARTMPLLVQNANKVLTARLKVSVTRVLSPTVQRTSTATICGKYGNGSPSLCNYGLGICLKHGHLFLDDHDFFRRVSVNIIDDSNLNYDPNNACRVGEAANPGPPPKVPKELIPAQVAATCAGLFQA